MIYIGIDNGVSGSIGTIKNGEIHAFIPMFTKEYWDYQEKGKKLRRIDTQSLYSYLKGIKGDEQAKALLEGPMINNKLWNATYSAIRAFEATLVILDWLKIGYEYTSVFAWRKHFMPAYRTKPSKNFPATDKSVVKSFMMDYANRVYPNHAQSFEDHGDPDGILIAKYFYETSVKPEDRTVPKEEPVLNM